MSKKQRDVSQGWKSDCFIQGLIAEPPERTDWTCTVSVKHMPGVNEASDKRGRIGWWNLKTRVSFNRHLGMKGAGDLAYE